MARPPTGQVLERHGKRGRRFAVRFRSGGRRYYQTLAPEVTTRAQAEEELANILADVRRGIWKPPAPEPILEAQEEPTLHLFASRWVERRRHEVDARTCEHWRWACSHFLGVLKDLRPSQIGIAQVEAYKTAKLRERERLVAELTTWKNADPETRGPRPPRPLSNRSVNATLTVLGQIFDDAIDHGYLESNPARGRKRRLKAGKPRRTWLEPNELNVLLDAAGNHRALIATMALGGLRVGEACALTWADVDLANGRLRVADAKTAAGRRQVDLSPMLLDELKLAKANATEAGPADLVFPTKAGTRRDRNNMRQRVLVPTVERANRKLAAAGRPLLADVTNHSLRRTYCSLLYEAGASPGYAMSQMGHESAALALEIYNKTMTRKRDTGERMDALLQAADWAPMGTSESKDAEPLTAVATETDA